MREFSESLNSSAAKRLAIMTPSSAGISGLTSKDILRKGFLADESIEVADVFSEAPSLEEKVFQALSDAKVWTAQVAMHLDTEARLRYFRQLDLLHDCSEWFPGDHPVQLASYQSFIRFMLLLGGNSKPALALDPLGHLIAIWRAGDAQLTIEFRPGNRTEWVMSRGEGDRIERAAGTNSIERIEAVLAPYDPDVWFR